MKKIIVAPDSFKGSLSAKQVADIIADEIAASYPDCTIVKIPIADGGEGSVEAIIAAVGGRIEEAQVLSPDERQIPASFGVTGNGQAVLEMAQSSGLTRQIGLHPMTASTYGFGQLILRSLDLGLRDFFLCLGGSATTDGGCGMAAALGVEFLDNSGKSFVPNGATLKDIAHMDISGIDKRVQASSFTVLCDVDNPLFGSNGAAYVYGPQKGADPTQVHTLDLGLRHLSSIALKVLGNDYAHIPGDGAAGGLGFGCMAFLQAHQVSGINAILELSSFKKHLPGADLIITGEGKLDSQSFSGKALSGILQSAGPVPVISICGVCNAEESLLRSHNLIVFETSEGVSAKESLNNPEKYLRLAIKRAMKRLD